jgi:hypothetical protein
LSKENPDGRMSKNPWLLKRIQDGYYGPHRTFWQMGAPVFIVFTIILELLIRRDSAAGVLGEISYAIITVPHATYQIIVALGVWNSSSTEPSVLLGRVAYRLIAVLWGINFLTAILLIFFVK